VFAQFMKLLIKNTGNNAGELVVAHTLAGFHLGEFFMML